MTNLTDTEIKLLMMVRGLRLFDMVEIKYSKLGEIQWTVTRKDRGTYEFPVDNQLTANEE